MFRSQADQVQVPGQSGPGPRPIRSRSQATQSLDQAQIPGQSDPWIRFRSQANQVPGSGPGSRPIRSLDQVQVSGQSGPRIRSRFQDNQVQAPGQSGPWTRSRSPANQVPGSPRPLRSLNQVQVPSQIGPRVPQTTQVLGPGPGLRPVRSQVPPDHSGFWARSTSPAK